MKVHTHLLHVERVLVMCGGVCVLHVSLHHLELVARPIQVLHFRLEFGVVRVERVLFVVCVALEQVARYLNLKQVLQHLRLLLQV